jgi:hypothetical protein
MQKIEYTCSMNDHTIIQQVRLFKALMHLAKA